MSLSDNRLLDAGVLQLQPLLRGGTRLEQLRLHGVGLTDTGARRLAGLLEGASGLAVLHAKRNPLGPEGLAALEDCGARRDWGWSKERLLWIAAMGPFEPRCPVTRLDDEVIRLVLAHLRGNRGIKMVLGAKKGGVASSVAAWLGCPLGIHTARGGCSCQPPKPGANRGFL